MIYSQTKKLKIIYILGHKICHMKVFFSGFPQNVHGVVSSIENYYNPVIAIVVISVNFIVIVIVIFVIVMLLARSVDFVTGLTGVLVPGILRYGWWFKGSGCTWKASLLVGISERNCQKRRRNSTTLTKRSKRQVLSCGVDKTRTHSAARSSQVGRNVLKKIS